MTHRTVRAFTLACLVATPFLACRRERGRDQSPPGDVGMVTYLDAEGKTRSLAEHRGKVVVIDVWATWCPPCRKSLPEVAELQRRGGDDFVVLAISVDRNGWSDVKPFLEERPELGLQAVIPASRTSLEPLGSIHGIPTTLIVDREGRIQERWAGYHPGRAEKAVQGLLVGK